MICQRTVVCLEEKRVNDFVTTVNKPGEVLNYEFSFKRESVNGKKSLT